jgi:hypothetical protein
MQITCHTPGAGKHLVQNSVPFEHFCRLQAMLIKTARTICSDTVNCFLISLVLVSCLSVMSYINYVHLVL